MHGTLNFKHILSYVLVLFFLGREDKYRCSSARKDGKTNAGNWGRVRLGLSEAPGDGGDLRDASQTPTSLAHFP